RVSNSSTASFVRVLRLSIQMRLICNNYCELFAIVQILSKFAKEKAINYNSLTSTSKPIDMTNNKRFDVIIIGGSYAGLSAAMALGRSLRRVLIIDSGQPCNEQTPHSHNFLTQDGEPPHVIARKA